MDTLPADVQALFDDLRRRGKKRPDLLLAGMDFEIARRLYLGETLQAIGDTLNISRQSVHWRKGVIRDTLQLWCFTTEDHDDDRRP